MADIVDLCRTVADGASSAWGDASEQLKPILTAASNTLLDAAKEIECLRSAYHGSCYACEIRKTCDCAWDIYNLNTVAGIDCLASK